MIPGLEVLSCSSSGVLSLSLGLSLTFWQELYEEVLAIKESSSSAKIAVVALLHRPSDLDDLAREELWERKDCFPEERGGSLGEQLELCSGILDKGPCEE